MNVSYQNEIKDLYQSLICAWNKRDAKRMSKQFAEKGIQIGFDGSMVTGRKEILLHLDPIFEKHPTAPFITKVKNIRALGSDTAILQAIAGMIPPGETTIDPAVNAHQTLVAAKKDNNWQIELFQNTPARFHGRPELVKEMTDELRQLI